MPSTADIRAAIAAALQPIADTGVQVSAYALWNPTPPTLYVERPEGIDYDKAMGRGHDDWTWTLTGLVGAVDDIGAQKRLDLLIDPSGDTSVKAALEDDPTLGGVVQDCWVSACRDYKEYRADQVVFLGAKWTLDIKARGT